MRAKPALNSPDLLIALFVLAFIVFGLVMVFDASVVEAYHEIGDQWYFIKNQAKFAVVGMLAAAFAVFFPVKQIEKLSLPIIISAILLLLVVLVPGIGIKVQGARRWLDIGLTRIQPSEYAKLAAIIYLSAWFSRPRPARSFVALIGGLIGLIVAEPDMGTALVVCGIAAVMYFLSGASIKKIGKIFLLTFMILGAVIALTPYRMTRVKTFFNLSQDPLGTSYHARQVLISLGSGGLFGTGLGKSRQKYQYLPEASTDSIFAVIGEEFGFVGGFLVVVLYTLLIFRLFQHVHRLKDPYMQNLIAGIAVWISVQVLLNLMAMIGLVPLTGVPLPFVSYGGSALVTIMFGIGLALNVSRYSEHPKRR